MVSDDEMLSGTVEIDEVYVGGKESNKHRRKRAGRQKRNPRQADRDRHASKKRRNPRVSAGQYEDKNGSWRCKGECGAWVHRLYRRSLDLQGHGEYTHAAVSHQKGEYVRGDVHTNSIESFWAVLKRGYRGVYHFMSFKHLGLYVSEFVYRFNVGIDNSLDTLGKLIPRMVGKRLTFADLKGEGGEKRQQMAI